MDSGRADEAPRAGNLLTAGWGTAVAGAVVTAVIMAMVAAAPVVIARLGSGTARPSVGVLTRSAGLLFLEFHHVGIVARFTRLTLPFGLGQTSGSALSLTVAVAMMTATLLASGCLFMAGRIVGNRCGGPAWVRGLQGMKVAVPYAAICFLIAFPIRFTTTIPGGLGSVSVHPSRVGAFLWPLAIAVVPAFAGGFRLPRDSSPDRERWTRRIRGAMAGGWLMLWLGLALSFAGLGVLAAIHPGLTADYFNGAFRAGALRGLAVVFLHSLVIPNMATWVLFPSMGACIGARGGGTTLCALSYANFPGGGPATMGASIPTSTPSPGYFLFLVVPLVAVLVGGLWAARRARVEGRAEAAWVGAGAGLVFAVLALAAAVLSEISIRVVGSTAFPGTTLWIGPDLASGALLALAWGVVGGALGGLLHAQGLPGSRPRGPTWEEGPSGEPPGDAR